MTSKFALPRNAVGVCTDWFGDVGVLWIELTPRYVVVKALNTFGSRWEISARELTPPYPC